MKYSAHRGVFQVVLWAGRGQNKVCPRQLFEIENIPCDIKNENFGPMRVIEIVF
ncbi:hypothetical protein [Desulfocicer vacuolatum]|uniref:hypothetical protein n=1 Tax=Desulfocicer vacuolatum TaxID=2298 RepID=UPI001BB01966|nr:hypothetical protein [Desulfocicer vacuolatum]